MVLRYHSNEWAVVKMEELSNNPESPNVSEFEDDDKSNLNLENFVLVNEDGSYAETGKTVISSEKVPKISLTKSSKFMNNVIDSVSNSSTTNLAISSSKMPELVPIAENLDEIDRVRCTMCKKMMLFQVLIFCVEFRELSHLTRDLSQAEKKITVVTS